MVKKGINLGKLLLREVIFWSKLNILKMFARTILPAGAYFRYFVRIKINEFRQKIILFAAIFFSMKL